MNLGETIKNLRIARHWTQDELAYRAKITAANISRIETGKHGPSTQLLESLASVFGMKMYQLVALAEGEKLPVASPEYDFTEQALLQNFRSMTPKEQELFMAMGERLAELGGTPQKLP
ncbi:helix-turn-helix domain-containing protein [Candidatus Ferrigenium straubiae]|jgi:transcriptional regulator with XRE-family HTH domain|uniref:helix-turn-helix domain-containing protein n=1 Tax=Candidatus Ferrigenium straubiae TaxID=2919506 RepID=UPI003F4A93A3